MKMGDTIGIGTQYTSQTKTILDRFKLEIAHRKREEEELRLIEEEKAKKAKKKK